MKKNELQVPASALSDPNAVELLRVWAANKSQHVSIRVGVWKDPAAWGIMINDLIGHIASAYYQHQGIEKNATIMRIRAAMDAEHNTPTGRNPEQKSM